MLGRILRFRGSCVGPLVGCARGPSLAYRLVMTTLPEKLLSTRIALASP
jgi:hypothetical protein